MNQAHFHLLITHLPITGTIIGVLTLMAGFVLKNQIVKRTGLALILIPAFFAFPAMLTGEGAEEIVEKFPGVDHHTIHEHEEKGEVFAWISGFLSLISLLTVWADLKLKSFATKLYLITLLLGIVVSFLGIGVGYTGGLIRHHEMDSATTSPQTSGEEAREEGDSKEVD